MSEEARAWHEAHGGPVLWSNSMFGGMPTYTVYMEGADNYIGYIQNFFAGLFPKPAYMLFVAMLCFYLLMQVLRVNRWLSLAGALAFNLLYLQHRNYCRRPRY